MQNPAVANTYLNVSFKDKDAAKALGARWDGLQKQWFVPPGRELAPFAQWQGCKSFCVNGQLAGNCCTSLKLQINDRHERIDRQLLADYRKPEDLIGENGLLTLLTKKLVERAL
jgi:hypothetical protein